MQKYDISRSIEGHKNIFAATFVATILVLATFTTLFLVAAPVKADGTEPTWPNELDWVWLSDDKNEDGTADNFRDVNTTYYYFDEDYLYLRLYCYNNAELNNDSKDGRFKWFFDLDGDAYVKGGDSYLTEYLLFVEDSPPEDGIGELYLVWDTDDDGYYNEWEKGPDYWFNEEVTNPIYANFSIHGKFVDFWIRLENITDPDQVWLLWATDQENPNIDQAPEADRPDNAEFIPFVINDPPVANDDYYTTPEDTTLIVSAVDGVLKNDSDPQGDPLTAIKKSDPSNGILTAFNADGSFTYVPDAGYCGSDSFTYVANDSILESGIATVHITITCENDQPKTTNQ